MKSSTTKKLFAFIITVMIFSSIPQLASAQKNKPCPPGYKLICINRGLNCWCVHNGKGNIIGYNATNHQSIATSFVLEQPSIVSIKIYDATGRLIKTLADKIFEQGEHKLQWDAAGVNAGIYMVQFNAGTYRETKKISIIK